MKHRQLARIVSGSEAAIVSQLLGFEKEGRELEAQYQSRASLPNCSGVLGTETQLCSQHVEKWEGGELHFRYDLRV